jgi:uncharacterized protein with ATP-grasp and redox domains
VKTYPECIPCILRATLGGARLAGASDEEAWAVVAEGARITADWDRTLPPILLGAEIGRLLRTRVGQTDPYRGEKRAANTAALGHYARWKEEVARAPDPLFHALRLAAAGNALDLGFYAGVDPHHDVDCALQDFARSDYGAFRDALDRSREVLFLADNAGEIVLDRILIEELVARGKNVTVAVRGGPTLNDATTDDAHAVGLDEVAEVITTGSDLPGVSLPASSPQFRTRFRSAELILSKGMGNFEGLSGEQAPLYFLLQAKCPPVAQETGVEVGRLIFLRGPG